MQWTFYCCFDNYWWSLFILKESFKNDNYILWKKVYVTGLLVPNTFRGPNLLLLATCTLHLNRTLDNFHILGSETTFGESAP